MNTFLNIGYISYLKEFEKCFMFSFSIHTRIKNATTFYCEAVVFKNEWTPKLKEGQKVFIKGSIALENYENRYGEKAIKLKLFAESIEIISEAKDNQKKQKQTNSYTKKAATTIERDNEDIPF